MDQRTPEQIEEGVWEALRLVYDPEIPVNIVEVGLIYEVKADEQGRVGIRMTLTSPNCPVAESLPVDVQVAARSVEGVKEAQVDIVWEPPWEPSMMSEAARLELNLPF
jgi:FeS assembly SUF system protein